MTGTGEPLTVQRVDAAIRFGALFARLCAYAAIWAVADRYDCGRAVLTGVLAGDLASRLVTAAWQWHDAPLPLGAELALLLLVWWCVRSHLAWPDEPALRAIVALAAFGVFTAQVGGTVLTRLGPSEHGAA